jgi:beta-lactamase class A
MLSVLLMLAAVAAPPPAASVHVATPRPYEVWDGRVTGRAPAGTFAVAVSAGPRGFLVRVGPDGRFDELVRPVRLGPSSVKVAARPVEPLWGVPAGSIAPLAPPRDDPQLAQRFAALAAETTPHVGVYSHAWNGAAAELNSGAEFEAASTLKLAIMLTALARNRGELSTSPFWEPMTRVTRYSDNAGANELLELIAGSDTAGAAAMVSLLHSLGLSHSYMAGGYLTGYGGGPPVVTVTDPPPSAYKHTTPAEMARLAGWLVAAAAGKGPLLRHGITPHEARELLYLMVQAQDDGLVRAGAGGLPVAHKIGWLDDTDNDVAIVFTHRGPVVISIYTVGTEDGSAERFGERATEAVLAAARE